MPLPILLPALAAALILAATSTASATPPPLFAHGRSLQAALGQARARCRAVIKGDARNAKGLAARALLYLGKFLYLRSTRDNRRAVAALRRLRRRFARSHEAAGAVFPLARALHRLGRQREARALLDRWAVDAERHNAAAWFAIAERAPSRWAIVHAKRAIALQPRDPAHREALARLLALSGRRAAARIQWKRAVTLRPKSVYYKRMLAKAR